MIYFIYFIMNNKNIILNLITIIIGFIIGIFIGNILFNKNIYKGPDSNIIVNQIYTDSDNKKYKWIPQICICPIDLSMNKLKDSNYVVSGH